MTHQDISSPPTLSASDVADISDNQLTRTALADTSSVYHSIRDVYIILDSDLRYRLAYAWSLPSNTRFIERMKHIQDAANHLSPATEFLKSRIYYIIRQIRQAVMERIELHRLRIEVPVFEHDSDSHGCDDELELPALID